MVRKGMGGGGLHTLGPCMHVACGLHDFLVGCPSAGCTRTAQHAWASTCTPGLHGPSACPAAWVVHGCMGSVIA